ncbi:MAG: hypothetical protein QG670_1182 [Thermoproteota archaeon]|nr:hypothetical protein [Thermoproteota archaeon]
MDDIDRKIIEFLQRDSRTPYTDVAKALSLSEGTVRRRIQNLFHSGIIKRFTVEVWEDNPKALVLVSTIPPTPTSQIAERILKLDGIESIFEVAGQDDIAVLASGDDIASINQCVDNIRSIEGVQTTNTLFVLRKWK